MSHVRATDLTAGTSQTILAYRMAVRMAVPAKRCHFDLRIRHRGHLHRLIETHLLPQHR
ncbi:hypothetical protein GGQ89_003965 [Sphingomonas yabuuchiae]|uniref:Uncharacterized protein n=1 Tax=Sphingomonas yabuuchiae TaxID=172044 RepID=A0ABR6KF67_9SPHN|nr:hypothetical protein [Sphingomonas yabuuchiae]